MQRLSHSHKKSGAFFAWMGPSLFFQVDGTHDLGLILFHRQNGLARIIVLQLPLKGFESAYAHANLMPSPSLTVPGSGLDSELKQTAKS